MVEGEWIEKEKKKPQNILHHLRATNIISSYLGVNDSGSHRTAPFKEIYRNWTEITLIRLLTTVISLNVDRILD